MERFHRGPSIRKRVFAIFASGAHSFDLPRDATFADLAGRLARLAERYDEVLVRVEVTTNAGSAAKHDAPAATHPH